MIIPNNNDIKTSKQLCESIKNREKEQLEYDVLTSIHKIQNLILYYSEGTIKISSNDHTCGYQLNNFRFNDKVRAEVIKRLETLGFKVVIEEKTHEYTETAYKSKYYFFKEKYYVPKVTKYNLYTISACCNEQ